MYFTPGYHPSEVGDLDVIAHEDRLHLFHLCAPNHQSIAHLVSDDGITWQPLPHALHVGDPGAFDDDQLWTMHTFRWKDRFYMLYTGLSKKEDGRVQRIGLAASHDLVRWRKVEHNPLAEPDPRWYEAGLDQTGWASWRDPFPWIEDGLLHVLLSACEKDEPYNRRGCVGHMTSQDALHWEVQPPLYTPRVSTDFEVPTLVEVLGKYYLLGKLCAPRVDVYRMADNLEGPWERPPHDWLLPPGNHAFCPVVWRGRTLLFHWIESCFDWGDPYRQEGRAIAPPQEAVALEDGRLALRSFDPAWEAVSAGSHVSPEGGRVAEVGNTFRGAWSSEGDCLTGACEPGMGLALLPGDHADFLLDLEITPRGACELGVVWRSDETADQCTRASIIPGRLRVELHRLQLYGKTKRHDGRGHTTLQQNHCPVETDRPVLVRIVAYGPYVEVSVNHQVLLVALTMSRRAGRLGFFLEDGRADFSAVRVTKLNTPAGFPL